MNKEQIRQVLNIPDALFVTQQIERANLRPLERKAVELRELQGLSVIEAAEAMNMCETVHKKKYRDGMNKLNLCWSSLPYIEGARKEYYKQ